MQRERTTDAIQGCDGCCCRRSSPSHSALAACGGDDDDGGTSGQRRTGVPEEFAAADRGAGRRPEGRRADGARRRRRRLHGPRRRLLPVHLHGHSARLSGRCSSLAARRRRGADARPRRGASPRSPRTARRSPSRSRTGSSTARPSTGRSPRPTSSTRSSARCCPASPTATRRSTSATSRASRRRSRQAEKNPTGGAPDIRASRRPTTARSVIKLDRTTALGVIQALSLPISAPVPEEYAKEFDAENPSTYGEHVVGTGPYMVENDAAGELTGYTPGKEIKMVRNPNWDGEATGLPSGLPRLDRDPGGVHRHRPRRRGRSSTASAQVNGDITPPPTVIRRPPQAAEPGPADADRQRRKPLHRAEHPGAAVRRHQRPQGGGRRRPTATALRNTRGGELVGPVATHFIPPGIPGFEEAGGLEGPRPRLPREPQRRSGAGGGVHEARPGIESGKCEGDATITMVGDDAPPDKETAEVVRGPAREARASRSSSGTVDARRHVHEVLQRTGPGRRTSARTSGWLKDFNDPQSILDADVQRRRDLPVEQLELAAARRSRRSTRRSTRPSWSTIRRSGPRPGATSTRRSSSRRRPSPASGTTRRTSQSTDVTGVINLFNANWDLAFTSLDQ